MRVHVRMCVCVCVCVCVCRSELEAAGHTAEELFGKHDADGDERFDREEYSAFKSLLKEL